MAKINEGMIKEIIALVGGAPNIAVCGNCMTRLRLQVHNIGLVNNEGVPIN
ncbi:PTS transporter subunit EIIB [Thorsellia kenyensis]|uniref:PTS transporter subunit EIIB n=1 Tax=Thorsellia kenyensis TaxID=1549888 RepID=A0ABV6CA60_9GAMM